MVTVKRRNGQQIEYRKAKVYGIAILHHCIEYFVVPDRHEAIVPEALFEKAQICMREYREREVMTGGGNPLKRRHSLGTTAAARFM